MADRQTCLDNAKIIDPNAKLCDQWICDTDKASYVYKFCHCQPPNPPQNPCPYTGNSPVPTYDKEGNVCYCCCSCFAWGTRIATPEGDKPIQNFVIGDQVLAAGADLAWTAYAVEFSQGIPPGPEYGKTMFTVYYQKAGGTAESMIVTADHVFLLADGSLKRTQYLVPGKDQLVAAADGKPVDLLSMEAGGWYGGLHHIATGDGIADSVDGHLLNSKGIVTGDWALQMADIEGGHVKKAVFKKPAHAAALTRGYRDAHPHLEGEVFHHAVKGAAWEHARPAGFRPYSQARSEVPEDACRFVTQQQARDIEKNAKQAPASSIIGQDVVAYLFRLFKGFYPDINFELDWAQDLPNAYSWTTYDVPFVVLNGGLVRIQGMNFSTLAVVLAHEIGHLYGGPPLTGNGKYSCEGQADYAATVGVLRGVLFPTIYPSVAPAGVDGVKRLFDFIDPDHRHGVPGQTCDGLSTDCRLQAFRAGLVADDLPECAGGGKIEYLELESAVATLRTPDGLCDIVVTFNQALDPFSATHRDDYRLEPLAEILNAQMSPKKPSEVNLAAKLTKDQQYALVVENVINTRGVGFKGGIAKIAVTWA
jgi:hypothetical protein